MQTALAQDRALSRWRLRSSVPPVALLSLQQILLRGRRERRVKSHLAQPRPERLALRGRQFPRWSAECLLDEADLLPHGPQRIGARRTKHAERNDQRLLRPDARRRTAARG